MPYTIDRYTSLDLEPLVDLFYETVHQVNARDYSEKARRAWAPYSRATRLQRWKPHLDSNITFVAKDNSKLIGFIDMTTKGHIHGLFVHKDYQGRGVASQLLKEVEYAAKKRNIAILTTDASITAKKFFEGKGFIEIKKNSVELKGVFLTNFSMKKNL